MRMMRIIILIYIITVLSGCDEIPPYSGIQYPLIPGLDLDTVEVFKERYWFRLTGGKLTLGSDGPNTAVTRNNAAEVSDSLMRHIYSVYRRAFDSKDSRVSLKQRFVDGKSGHVDLSGSCTGLRYDYEFDFIAAFHDYAGWDSELYIGGKLHYSGKCWSGNGYTEDAFGTKFIINGSLDFAGQYRGSVTLVNVEYYWGAWATRYSGMLLIKSGGELFIYDLYKLIQYG